MYGWWMSKHTLNWMRNEGGFREQKKKKKKRFFFLSFTYNYVCTITTRLDIDFSLIWPSYMYIFCFCWTHSLEIQFVWWHLDVYRIAFQNLSYFFRFTALHSKKKLKLTFPFFISSNNLRKYSKWFEYTTKWKSYFIFFISSMENFEMLIPSRQLISSHIPNFWRVNYSSIICRRRRQ